MKNLYNRAFKSNFLINFWGTQVITGFLLQGGMVDKNAYSLTIALMMVITYWAYVLMFILAETGNLKNQRSKNLASYIYHNKKMK